MSSVKKQPTLLVAEIEEAGALHRVLRSQTSRCVVLNLVVHGALIARVVIAFVVLAALPPDPYGPFFLFQFLKDIKDHKTHFKISATFAISINYYFA